MKTYIHYNSSDLLIVQALTKELKEEKENLVDLERFSIKYQKVKANTVKKKF